MSATLAQSDPAEKWDDPALQAEWNREVRGASRQVRALCRDRLRERISFVHYLRAERARHTATLAVSRAMRAGRAGGRKPIRTRRRSGSAAHSARASGSSLDSGDPPGEPPNQPIWLEPRFESIPSRLKTFKHWVIWRARWDAKRGKWTGPPSRTSGWPASHSNPAHWDAFEQARLAYQRGGWTGVGYVLAADDLLTGIDLDHCRDPETGRIASWALRIIKRFASYTEISPSSTGIRIFVIAKLPGTGHKRRLPEFSEDAAIEIYDKQRFLTLTGHRLRQSPTTIKRRQRVVNDILREFFPPPVAAPAPTRAANPQGLDLADRAVLDIALASQFGRKFYQLYYEGDLSAHGHDHSAADYSLIRSLSFFSGGDREQVERLFSESALVREKWTNRPDYRKRTIDRALLKMTHFYQPGHRIDSLMRLRG